MSTGGLAAFGVKKFFLNQPKSTKQTKLEEDEMLIEN